MNGPFRVAQADTAGQTAGKPPARIVQVTKPYSEQSVTVPLSYDGSVKADLSAIAGEKITLVHIGEKLIILFDNKSTITLEPFFDSTGKPLNSITVEVSPGRDLTGTEFAALFPVTEDQSVLPAAGEGGNAQASGAYFVNVPVDPLGAPNPLDLLGQEELPNFVITNILAPVVDSNLVPTQIVGARVGGVTEEEQLGGQIIEGPPAREQQVSELSQLYYSIASGGKEDPNDVTLPNSGGTTSDGLDQDTPANSFVTTQFFHGDGANALTNLLTGGNPPFTFTIDGAIVNATVTDGTGAVVKSAGHELHYSAIDTTVAGDNTVVGGYSEGDGFHEVFRLTIHSDGTYDFELLDKIDHPVHSTDAGSTSHGHLEETLFLDFTTLVHVADIGGDNFTLTGTGAFTIGVIDDTPEVSVTVADADPLFLATLDESVGADLGDGNASADDVAGNTAPDPTGTNPFGEVKSADGALANLFSVSGTTGEDGFGSVAFAFTLTLSGAGVNGGVATSLSVTDPNHAYGSNSTIYLFTEGGQIVGRVGSAQGAIALRISVENGSDPATAHFVVDQYLPVNHGGDSNNFDSSLPLTLVGDGALGVTLTTTVTDGDGDVATSAANVTIVSNETSIINIEDDGPTVTAGEGSEIAPLAVLDLDETRGADRYNTGETESGGGASNGSADDKAAAVTVSVAPLQAQAIGELSTAAGAVGNLFTAAVADFGTDGPAAGGGITKQLSLVLSSETVGTSLTATALVGTPLAGMDAAHRAIELVQVNATTIEGRLVGDGIPGNGDEYVAFRITLENPSDPATAKITVDQFLAIDHGGTENPSVFDEQTLLTLLGNSTLNLQLVTTVTDGDGDHVSLPAQVNLIGSGNSFIAFDDDGPSPLNIAGTNGAANGLFFDGFIPNNDQWGAGSGTNSSGTAGAWHIAASPYEGASTIQLERVGDNYRGSDSPTNSVMVDLEATPGNVQVSQDLTLVSGALYHLTFEIGAAIDPGFANSAKLEVLWNGVSVGTYTPTSGLMQTISIDVTAAGINNQLTFREIGEAGDNTGTFLANVKLSDVIIIDETKGVDPDSNDTATDLGALFATITNNGPVGVDPGMDHPQYAKGDHPVVVLGTPDFGTDGPAAVNPIQIGLSVSAAGVDSGLTTTEGKAIHLYVEGALVVGRFDSDNNGTYDTAAFAFSIDPNTGVLSIAQYVSLHHPIAGNPDEGVYLKPGTVLATVTLTDGDGDHTTTSADISNAVRFEDDGPSIDPLQNSSLRDWMVDEDVLPAANHSAPNGNDEFDSPADENDFTLLNDKPLGVTWGADGPKALTFAATDSQHPTILITDQNGTPVAGGLSSGGVALTYVITTNPDGGQTVVAYKGAVHSAANEIFTLTLDPDAGTSGTFSFELKGALDHPDGAGQNTLNLRFDFTATDGDLDTAASFLTLRITDDVPYASGQIIARVVDEDDIDTPWSQGTSPDDGAAVDGSTTENSTGAAFISGTLAGLVAPGADLPGTFAFTTTAVAQLTALGLFSKETAQGNGENGKPLSYVISNGPPGSHEIIITGNEPNPQGNPVFSLTLNTETGAYEFRLFDELIHMPGGDQNDDLRSGQPSGSPLVQHSIPYLDLGSIITYTDKDGDPVNLGGKFTVTITDDVPHADIDLGRGSVTVDETPGNQADDTTSSSVRNLFATLEATFISPNNRLVGDDPDVSGDNNGNNSGNGAIAYAHSNFALVTDNSTIGSDSPPYPHQYSLSIEGVAFSGLYVTDGSPINLSVNADGLVIGTVVGGAFNGKVAFAIAIESDGEVSVAQYLSIKHDDKGDFNESNDNGFGSGDATPNDTPDPVQQTLDGKIVVTLTVTDSDGDHATDTANIGKLITFLDDGPSLDSNATVSLEDDDLPGGNEGGIGDDNAPQNASGTLSHDYGADGPGSTLLTGIGLPSGQGFTSVLASDGLSLVIKQNGVDVLKIALSDSEDGHYTVTQLHAIDHPTLNGQNGDDTENNVEFTVSYRVTDGDGDYLDGSLKINVDDDMPDPDFVLQSGKVTIDETAGLQNITATPAIPGDANDNDTSGPFPAVVTNPGIPSATSTLFGAPQFAQSNGPIVGVTPHYGADGPGGTVFAIDIPGGASTSSGLTTISGQAITLFEVDSTLIVGRYDGPDNGSGVSSTDPAAFAIHIDPTTGVISVVQYIAIKHDDRGDFDESNDTGNGNDAAPNDTPDPVQQSIINGAIRVTVTVTDHDGDSVDAQYNIGNKIVFEDDGPTISITATGEADVVLTTQDAETIGANVSDTASSTANFSGVFATTTSYGADGGGTTSLTYTLAVTGQGVDSHLDSHNASIYLYEKNGVIVGSTSATSNGVTDGNTIFSISVNGSGEVTLTQFQQIDHPIGSDPTASASPFDDQYAVLGDHLVTLTRGGSITDADGDTASAGATIDLGGNIRFTDDGPSATTTAAITVDEDNLGSGNNDTTSPGDDTASLSPVTGTLGFTPGADAPATVSFAPLHNTAVLDAAGHAVTAGGVALKYFWDAGSNTLYASTDGTVAHAAFKVQVTNPSTGAYSFSLLGQVDHPGHDADGQNNGPETAFEDNININLTYTVTDYDKDTATGTLSVSIDDDMPIIGASPAPANLIQNGSFEDHGPVSNPGFDTFEAISHWTSGPDNVPFEIQQGDIGDLPPQDGSAKVELDSDPLHNPTSPLHLNATIQQTISTPLAAGASYELSFWYSPRPNDGNADSSSLKVYWNGVVVHTIDSSTQADGWQHVSVLVTAQGGANTVAFQGGGQENQLGAYLDNVSLVPAIFVDEDGLGAGTLSQGNHDLNQPGDNVVPNTDGDNNEATSTGHLNIKWGADNVDKGAEGPLGAFGGFRQDHPDGVGDRSVTFTNANVAVTGVSTLYSKGDEVTFSLNGDHTVLTGTAGGRTVFEVSLTDDGTGQFRFVLLDQLDHAPGNNENDIGLSFNFTATDSDGDAVNSTFVVGVDDDVPVASTTAHLNGRVDEDDLSANAGDNSTGILFEGSGLPDSTTDKYVFTAANLGTLIAGVGADEPGSVVLQSSFATGTAVKDIGGNDVKSHGFVVKFAVDGSDVVGFADADGNGVKGAGENEVFRLSQDANGNITFNLQDQIDHPNASGDNGILTLNLSAALLIKDNDGDTAPVTSGAFTVDVENDIPADTAAVVTIHVAEDTLSTSAPAPADFTNGNPDADATTDEDVLTNAALQTLVISGADDAVVFSLNTGAGGVVLTSNGENATSHGANIRLGFDGTNVVGYVNGAGGNSLTYDAGIDRIVFQISDIGGGNFKFDLRDKIDHISDTTGFGGLGDDGTLLLDISKALLATDFDGDSVNLGLGSILVSVENDVPTVILNADASALTVDETFLGTNAFAAAASFFSVSYGADGPAAANQFGGFALHVKSEGVDSGLIATASNQHVFLFEESGVIVGRFGADAASAGTGTGNIAFTLKLDGSNDLVLDQILAVVHPDHASYDEPKSLIAADLITLSATATDFDADAVTGTINIGDKLVFKDDGPAALADTNSVTEGALLTVNAVNGVLFNDTAGADGYATGGGVIGVRAVGLDTTTAVTNGVDTDITGLHGTLHLKADGSYTYQSTADDITSNTTDVFVYTIKDGDGDLSTTTLTINLADVTILAPADNDVLVYESALDTTVTNPDLAAGSVTGSLGTASAAETDASNQLNATGGAGTLTYTLVGSSTGTYGTIHINPDGSYVYTLTSPYDTSPDADNLNNTEENRDSFTYKVTDANGNTQTGTITVDIVDDVPTVSIDNIGPADPTTVAEGGTISGDWNLVRGADGVTAANFTVSINGGTATQLDVGTAIDTGKGLLTFNANGTWTFVAANNLDNDVDQKVTFTLKATDGDGDTSTDSHTISVTDGTNPSPSGSGLTLQMDDQNLSDGSTPAGDDFAQGTVAFTAGSDALTGFAFAAGTGALAGGLTWNRVSDTLIEGFDGATKIVSLLLTPPVSIAAGGTGSATVTATLVNNYDSHPGINLDDLAQLGSIGVVASDHDGDSVTQTVTLSVSDDVPSLNIVDTPSAVNEGQTINGTWTLTPGADGVASVDVTITGGGTQILSLTNPANVVTFNLATGTLTVDADLQWHFTANSVTSNQQVTFSIKATDGDNDTSSDSQTITIQNVNQPLVITAVTGIVEEEHGLPGGIDDTTSGTTPDNLDTDVADDLTHVTNVASGSFSTHVTGGIDGTLSYAFASLSGNPAVNTVSDGPLTAGGKPVLFAMDGSNLIGYVNSDGGTGAYSSATDTKVFTVTLNQANGNYTFTLNAPVDHPINTPATEDAITINLDGRVTVTDSGGPAADTNVPLNASITVIDDVPVAAQQTASVNEGQKPTMNVVFVIDTSGSMGDGNGSRMELAKAAAINLLNNSAVDFNQIMVVSFASAASNNTPIWADKADAISYISGLSSDGNTDYDAALAKVTSNWGNGPTPADQTVVYFISDGEPTDDNGTGSVGIVGAEQTAWESFLASKSVTASYAVGISTSVNDTDLTPISWAPGNPNLPPVIISNAGDLSTTLSGSLPGSVSGSVLANGSGFGADGGHVKSITINGTTYTFDGNATIAVSGDAPGAGDTINANGKQITITTDLGGKLVFNFAANGTNQAGEWDYTAPSNLPATSHEIIAYTLVDRDGDTAHATLDLTVNNVNAAPSGTDNVVTAQEDVPLVLTAANFGFTDPGDTPPNALLKVKISTLETAGALKLNGVDVTQGQDISVADINAGLLTFTGAQNANGSAYSSFTFQVQDNGGTANGGHDLDQSPNKITINVTAVNDPASISGTSTGTVVEAGGVNNATPGTPSVSFNLNSTDVDNANDSWTAVTAGAATDNGYGTFGITSAGVWTYTLNNNNAAVQALNTTGGSLSDTFTVTTIDGTAQLVTVTINGANDAPITDLNGAANGTAGTAAFTEQTPVLIAPSATLADVDSANLASMTVTLTNRPDGNSAESLSLNSAALAAAAGLSVGYTASTGVLLISGSASRAVYETILEGILYNDTSDNPNLGNRTVSVVVNDGSLSSVANNITIGMSAVNDPASITGLSTGTVVEAGGVNNATPGTPTASGNLNSTDVDNANDSWAAVAAGAATDNGYGTFGVLANGTWTYTLNNNNAAVQALNTTGGSLSDTFTVTTIDGTPQLVTVTINGANDAPTTDLNGVANGTAGTASFTEQIPVLIAPSATLADVDSANLASMTVTLTNRPDGNSAESLSLNSAALAAAAGLSVGYTASTGVLLVSGPASKAVYETILEGILYNDTSDNPNLGNRTVSVVVNDGSLSSTANNITIGMSAVNDPASITGLSTGTVIEAGGVNNAVAGTPAASGNLNSTDVDNANDSWTTVAAGAATDNSYGTFGITSAGVWTYTLNNNNAAVEALNTTGGSLSDTFTVKTIDGTEQVVTVTINGANDAPTTDLNGATIGTAVTTAFTEQTPVLIAPSATLADVDSANLASMTVTLTNRLDGNSVESLSLNSAALAAAAGLSVSYTASTGVLLVSGPASKAVYETILEGILYNDTSDAPNTTDRTVSVVVSDGSLSSTTNNITIDINPVNDAPTATITKASYSATEQIDLSLHNTGMSISDPDSGNNDISVTLSVGFGTLTVVGGNSGVNLITGSGTNSVTITGTVAEINNLLAGTDTNGGSPGGGGTIVYNANSDAPPADATLTLLVNDTGDSGSGGPLSDTHTATINIAPVNDPPTAVDDNVIVNVAASDASVLVIPELLLLLNDSDPENAALDITSIAAVTPANNDLASVVLTNPDSITVTNNTLNPGNDSDWGHFTYTLTAGGQTDTATVTISIDTGSTMDGGNGNDTLLDLLNNQNTTLNGGDGNDILYGGTGNDSLNGGANNDTYVFGLTDGNDTIQETSGTDQIRIIANGAALSSLNFENGSSDNLIIQYNGQQITVTDHFATSGEAVETIRFDGGATIGGYALGSAPYALSTDDDNNREAAAGVNTILAGDSGDETLTGNTGNDLLFGNGGADTLIGGEGNDLLVGGTGADTLTGGLGADVFRLTDTAAVDIITDFNQAQGDKIDLTALFQVAAGHSLSEYVSHSNGNLLVDVNGNVGGTNFVMVATSLPNTPNAITIMYEDAAHAVQSATV